MSSAKHMKITFYDFALLKINHTKRSNLDGHVEIMGKLGIYVGIARMQHDKSRVLYEHGQGQHAVAGLKTMHYIEPDPGGPQWLSIQ